MSQDRMPLGQTTRYTDQYEPQLLFPLSRAETRANLELQAGWPWFGADVWQAYELSWLRPGGVPVVAMMQFTVPACSPCLVESKSVKLYLNSLSGTVFVNLEAVRDCLVSDLSAVTGSEVAVTLQPVDENETLLGMPSQVQLIDHQDLSLAEGSTGVAALNCDPGATTVTERLGSHLLKSLCPVTGQPDWGSLVVEYSGQPITHEGLLRYLVGFRGQQDFHEHCVERIFLDLLAHCKPRELRVRAYYTRRGGVDINPWRSTDDQPPAPARLRRQ